MKEIFNFLQDDLNNNDIMVLDVFSTVYMWVGRKSNETERNNILKKVEKYVENITDGRDPTKVQFVQIEPCSEPFGFTTHFPEWEEEVSERWLEMDPYEAAMARIEAERKAAQEAKWGKKEETKFIDESNTFDVDTLRKSCPD